MKRLLIGMSVIGLMAFITLLLVTRHLEQARADRLDRALMDAEARLVQLEGDLKAAQQQLEELKSQQEMRLSERQAAAKSKSSTAPGGSGNGALVSEPRGSTQSAPSGPQPSPDRAVVPEVVTSLSAPVLYSAAPGSLVRIEALRQFMTGRLRAPLLAETPSFLLRFR